MKTIRLQPIEHHWWELLIMRIALTCMLIPAVHFGKDFTSQPEPNGIAKFVDLTFLCQSPWQTIAQSLYWIALGAYVSGIRVLMPIGLGIILAVHAGYMTLANSQGAIHHTGQFLSLVVLAQLIAHAFLVTRPAASLWRPCWKTENWAANLSIQTIAASYVVSAISKLVYSGGTWLADTPRIVLQIKKTAYAEYFSTLKQPDEKSLQFVQDLVMGYPLVAQILLGAGFFLEFFAFVAFFGRRSALVIGLGLIGMHTAISQLMNLGFLYNKLLLLIFFVGAPYWIWKLVSRKRTT